MRWLAERSGVYLATMEGTDAVCVICGEPFKRKRKRGRTQERCDGCRRSNRVKPVEKACVCALPGCGVRLNTDPFRRGQPRKFCSPAHRQKFYRDQMRDALKTVRAQEAGAAPVPSLPA